MRSQIGPDFSRAMGAARWPGRLHPEEEALEFWIPPMRIAIQLKQWGDRGRVLGIHRQHPPALPGGQDDLSSLRQQYIRVEAPIPEQRLFTQDVLPGPQCRDGIGGMRLW